MISSEFIDVAICKNCKYYNSKDKNCPITIDATTSLEPVKVKETDSCANFTEKNKEDKLLEIYRNLIDIQKKYIDINPIYYPVIAVWIIGTYIHNQFRSYPFLFFNAMKGSGKTRALKLITYLAKDGEILNSMTEAVLFRTKGTLAIDEFEGLSRRGNDNLRELLNSAYKKGTKVKRMKKVKTLTGEEQQVEEFDVYRPILLANILGMDNVLGDRCISVVIEKSNNKQITRLIEIFDQDTLILGTKELLLRFSVDRWCSMSLEYVNEVSKIWNEYIINMYTTTRTNNYTKLHLMFEKIRESEIDGRVLELTMPLFIIANEIGEDILLELIEIIKEILEERKVDDIYNNKDVAIIDFISQEPQKEGYDNFISIAELTRKFKDFLGENEDWINNKFVSRALERTKLILKKKRLNNGVYVLLDYKKAQDKIRMFK